jgi:hypothetical protein
VSALLLLLACGDGAKTVPTGDTAATDTAANDTATPDTAPPTPLALCVNELMPSNGGAYRAADGTSPDWVELHNPGATDVDLSGWTIVAEDAVGPLTGTLPAGGFLLLEAIAPQDTPQEDTAAPPSAGGALPFALPAEGGALTLRDPDGRSARLSYGAAARDFAHARVADCCTGEGCWEVRWGGSPGASNVERVPVAVELLALGQTWAYWDAATAPASGWDLPAFDDAAWARGVAPLGYGDAQSTVTAYGADPYAKPLTQWFRARVALSGTADLARAWVDLVRDDGARVVLNGVEVARSNLPEGALAADTPALSSVGDAAETTPVRLTFDPALLVEGENVLAVEVHQFAPDSSDLTFDLALGGERLVR